MSIPSVSVSVFRTSGIASTFCSSAWSLSLLGTILDSTSIMLLTMPIMVPVVLKLGFDNLWFGMVSILAIELGQLTPPCGMVMYAMKAAMPTETTIDEIFSASMPFFYVLLIALAVIIWFPQVTLWLPKVMF